MLATCVHSYAQLCSTTNPCTSEPIEVPIRDRSFGGGAINVDGTVVVGGYFPLSENPQGVQSRAFRWTAADGTSDIGTLGGVFAIAADVNDRGDIVVGTSSTTTLAQHAFRWTPTTGMIDIHTLGAGSSRANGVSGDGAVVVGTAELSTLSSFRWTSEAGMQIIGDPTILSSASGTNRDGSVVVGFARFSGSEHLRAYRWTGAGGMQNIGTIGADQSSFATSTNSDGSVVVGTSYLSRPSGFNYDEIAAERAFRWTAATGMVDLGNLGGRNPLGGPVANATSVSGNGQIVVGSSLINANQKHAFRWTAASGIRDLNLLLVAAGVNMRGIEIVDAADISRDGRFILGRGVIPNNGVVSPPYIIRYDDGAAGVTNIKSVATSIDDLARSRHGVMAQHHGLVAPLLGRDKPVEAGNHAGGFAAGGSATAGGYAQVGLAHGFALLGGLSWSRESYPDAEMHDALTGAAALRYVHEGFGAWRPLIEAGGWHAPEADLRFSRSYANGAGTAVGNGRTHGDLSYYYGRAGIMWAPAKSDQVVITGEVGRQHMSVNGYAETVDAQNPFEATVAASEDSMTLGRLQAQWSHRFTSSIDMTLWAAGVRDFDWKSDLVARVSGVGTFSPTVNAGSTWAEYGARAGLKLTDAITLDAFANGVSGDNGVAARVHGGAGLRIQF